MEKKSNIAHSTFQRLLNIAKANHEDFNLVLSRYGMERFLYRLSTSPHKDQFVLKGASLFLIWYGRSYRVTKDADFLGFGDPDLDRLTAVVKDICSIKGIEDDGMIYLPESVKASMIREGQIYEGVRVTLMGVLNKARIHLQIDVGFGDQVTPPPELVIYPTLLDSPAPHLKTYSRYTLVAEKIEIMVKLGLANSRMKDFYDVWLLVNSFEFDYKILVQSLIDTFERRGTALPEKVPFAFTEDFSMDNQKQAQWNAFTRKSKAEGVSNNFAAVIAEIKAFAMPVFSRIQQKGAD